MVIMALVTTVMTAPALALLGHRIHRPDDPTVGRRAQPSTV